MCAGLVTREPRVAIPTEPRFTFSVPDWPRCNLCAYCLPSLSLSHVLRVAFGPLPLSYRLIHPAYHTSVRSTAPLRMHPCVACQASVRGTVHITRLSVSACVLAYPTVPRLLTVGGVPRLGTSHVPVARPALQHWRSGRLTPPCGDSHSARRMRSALPSVPTVGCPAACGPFATLPAGTHCAPTVRCLLATLAYATVNCATVDAYPLIQCCAIGYRSCIGFGRLLARPHTRLAIRGVAAWTHVAHPRRAYRVCHRR